MFGCCFILLFTAVSAEEFHYSVHSKLPAEHVHSLVKKENGQVHHYVETVDAYHVVLPVKLEPATLSKLTWLKNTILSWMNCHNFMRLHEHPQVLLIYQPTLRVTKRSLAAYTRSPQLDLSRYTLREISRRPPRMLHPDDAKYDEAYDALARILKEAVNFNDPASVYAWQYLNDGHRGSGVVGFDMNIYPLYAKRLTGKGIRSLILDDAIDRLHWDLKDNYDGNISVNLNEPLFRADPRGSHEIMQLDDSHGTQCAGLIAAVANNGICSHGVAYQSKVGAVRMLAGPVTDILEANALSYRQDVVDIYCASWGPSDDGQTMDLPRNLTGAALAKGSQHGRRGLGSIVIYASGNGGSDDHCGADGFVSSPDIIAVAALTDEADQPFYGESCSATRIAVPVAGSSVFFTSGGNILPSTTLNNQCTMHFVGTSAAAPLAAGCFALALEVRPNISKRDLENILPWSGRVPTPADKGWQVNGAGVLHSPSAGFGLLDCTRMVHLTQMWRPVGPLCRRKVNLGEPEVAPWAEYQDAIFNDSHFHQLNATTLGSFREQLEELQTRSFARPMNTSDAVEINFDLEENSDDSCELEVVEKVAVSFQWKHMCRGMINIELTSPSGTLATILGRRRLDQFAGAVNMTVNSVTFWGEGLQGKWQVKIQSNGECNNDYVNQLKGQLGTLIFLQLEFWGSTVNDSAFERNKDLLMPFITDVSKEALQKGRGHLLTDTEVKQTFNSQRWIALKHTKQFLQESSPESP
ncbi:PC3-like endoprotease variant A [Clonorchis sinensis]|uniref:PC3-like endoprotease variant A n=1 Tax=Clonorchis sinensis TaxID=79923 RepID=A0A8T1MKS1_CLOSI|nr:PC3-like endoprotease variant A [Clonorchis sinensis]